jgi:alcohol dehydrogenase
MTRQPGFRGPPGSAGISAGEISARVLAPKCGHKTSEARAESAALRSFDLQPRTRVLFGLDSVDQVGQLARDIGAKKVLLVTDLGIVEAGHAERVRHHLDSARLQVAVFDQARENPTTKCVEDCVAVAKSVGIDTIIGLGGGSAMDTAKGCNFLLTNGGVMQDYRGVGKATKPMLPLIAIPTTAGTGSECQSAALIVDEKTHQKMACLDPKAAARIAILDPSLTLSQPARVTACTGIDAIAHAAETAVTTKRNPLSLMFSHEAFKLCVKALPEVLLHPNDIEARGRMQLGAALAGMAIENSMLGAAHAAANPLTAHYGIVHGQAVGMMLPAVIRFNGADPAARHAYAELASAPEIASVSGDGHDQAWQALVARVEALLDLAHMPPSLADCGVDAKMIPKLAREAARQWTANFNARPVTKEDFVKLYEAAFARRDNA